MKSFGRRSFSFTKREVHNESQTFQKRSSVTARGTGKAGIFAKKESDCKGSGFSPTQDNRLKCKFEAIDVLLQILLYQEELTLKEYTINDRKIKVLVIEDTEL